MNIEQVPQIVLTITFLSGGGFFDGLCDRRRDSPKNNMIYYWMEELSESWMEWYLGNPRKFINNGMPWTSDYWHLMKQLRIGCWTGAMCSYAAVFAGWWAFAVAPLIAVVVGQSFRQTYHKWFPHV